MSPESASKDAMQAEYLANRLKKNERHLRKWARSRDIQAIRLYDRDIPEIPLAIDKYSADSSDALVIALYERPYDKPEADEAAWLDLMATRAGEALGVEKSRIFLKTRRRMEGLRQYEAGGDGFSMVVRESGLKFKVELSRFLDTGLFLDHRPARAMIRALAAGKRILNLFSYTGSFSAYAAAGGALKVTSVDLSNTYLDWSKENFTLNGLSTSCHEFVKSDVRLFLEEALKLGRSWDILVIDPPTFSNSHMAPSDFDAARDWPEIIEASGKVLSPDGLMLFSTNARNLRWDPALAGLASQDISAWSIPPDFRNTRIHRCWVLGNIAPAVGYTKTAP